MGDECDAPIGLVDRPDGQRPWPATDPSLLEEACRTSVDAVGEGADRLATVETVPAGLDRALAQLAVELLRHLGGLSVPIGVTDLLEPRGDLLVDPEPTEQRLGGLAGTHERRDEDLVERLVTQLLCHRGGLSPPELGEGRIDHVEAVADPFGLSVTDEHDLHVVDGTVTAVTALDDVDTAPNDGGSRTSPWVRVLLTVVVAIFVAFWTWALFFASKEAINKIDDTGWAARAEAICVRATEDRLALANLTRIDQPTPELIRQRAALVDESTDILERMLDDLVAVEPFDEKGQDVVPLWEDDYRIYLGDRRRYAEQLRASGDNLPFYETAIDGLPISERIATFAGDNEMSSCSPPIDLTR